MDQEDSLQKSQGISTPFLAFSDEGCLEEGSIRKFRTGGGLGQFDEDVAGLFPPAGPVERFCQPVAAFVGDFPVRLFGLKG